MSYKYLFGDSFYERFHFAVIKQYCVEIIMALEKRRRKLNEIETTTKKTRKRTRENNNI